MSELIHRLAAGVFNTALWRPLLLGKEPNRLESQIRAMKEMLPGGRHSNFNLIQQAYSLMESGYRNEYYYKNLITSKLFVGRHRATNAALIHELRVGRSVADSVLINGFGTVYEIKTEFDDSSKLNRQFSSYWKSFPRVIVVVPMESVSRYYEIVKSTPAGIVGVKQSSALSIVRPPMETHDNLDRMVIYQTLRVGEVERIIRRNSGRVPNVPNGVRFEAYFDAIKNIPVVQLQTEMQRELKRRAPRNCRGLLLESRMQPLRTILLQLDPSLAQQRSLIRWLSSNDDEKEIEL